MFTRMVDQMPPAAVLADIDAKVDQDKLEAELMREGVAKFADPFKALIKLLEEKQQAMATA
jgi:transaldolase